MAELVLASASPTRRAILHQAGLHFRVIASDTDESLFDATTPVLVEALARQKSRAVAARLDHGLVLGCDSLLDVDGVAYGKPASKGDAIARWKLQRGRSGTLFTGHVLIDASDGREVTEVVATVVHFGVPSDEEIARYVDSQEPLDKAGAFTLEGRSSAFLRGIDGDAGNVRGLSIPALSRLLGALGWSVMDFWRETAH